MATQTRALHPAAMHLPMTTMQAVLVTVQAAVMQVVTTTREAAMGATENVTATMTKTAVDAGICVVLYWHTAYHAKHIIYKWCAPQACAQPLSR